MSSTRWPAPGSSDAASPPDAFSLSRRDKSLALAGTLVALLMAGLDQTIVSTAGPEIQRDLQIPASLYAWLTTAYLVSSTVMLPIYGKLSDVFGRKPILLTGVGLFLLGSLLCGLAPTTMFLIGARAIQGLGAASLFTTTLAVIADLFPPSERGKYMGLIGGVMGISSVVGPIVGGIITDALGWHWVFFINLPVGAIATWLIVAHMPRLGGRRLGEPAHVDIAGAFWLIGCVIPLLLALSLGRPEASSGDGFAWTSAPIIGLFGAAAAALVAFLITEKRAADPIIDLSLFGRDRIIGLTTLTMFVLGATFLFSVVFLPLYMVNVLGASVTRAGLSMTPLTLGMVATSIAAGQVASRVGHVKLLLVGALTLLAAAFAVLGFTLSPESSETSLALLLILIGAGMGPTLPLYILIVQNAARPQEVGVVTAGSIFSRSMGQVIGLAMFGTLFASVLISSVAGRTGAVLDGLTPGARLALAAVLPDVTAGSEGVVLAFDPDRIRQAVDGGGSAADAVQGAAVEPAGPGGERVATSTGPLSRGDRTVALRAVDSIEEIYKQSLSEAVAMLYRIGAILVIVALVLTIFIPDAPPRLKRPGPAGGLAEAA